MLKKMFAIGLGVVLCLAGILLILFELAMLGSETALFLSGAWRVFVVFVFIGVTMCAGGVLLIARVSAK